MPRNWILSTIVAVFLAPGLSACGPLTGAPANPDHVTLQSIALPSVALPTAAPVAIAEAGVPDSPPAAAPKPAATSTAPLPAATTTAAQSDPTSALIERGPRSNKVAITLDMGSVGDATPDVLATLKANGVRATFFVTGKWAEENPDLLRAIVADGHEVGNHSYSHPDFTKLGPADLTGELARTEAIVQRIAGVSTRPYWLPPFGAYDDAVLQTASDRGYRTVYWTVDGLDWRDDSTIASVIAHDVRGADGGGIILMNGGLPKTASALPAILTQLKAKGLVPTTLTDVLRSPSPPSGEGPAAGG